MPTPSGQITLDDIWIEPNPSWTSSESFSAITYNSWAQGPLGANTYSWNGWGNDGGNSGADVIGSAGGYLQQGVTPINFANYSNLYYYFDGSITDIVYKWQNTTTNPPPVPPNPPIINDAQAQIDCYDYSNTYKVHPTFSINANANSSSSYTQIPGFTPNTSPYVENVYWSITITVVAGNTISTVGLFINGSSVWGLSGLSGYGGGTYTWQSSGAAAGTTFGGQLEYDFLVQ